MKQRIEGCDGGYPIWFYAFKPDLRRKYGKSGELNVLIECEIRRDRVLLSDHDSWHVILNNGYFAHSEAEDDEWYRRLSAGEMSKDQAEVEKRKSWERVFDLEAIRANPEWHGKGPLQIQVTCRELYLSEVRSHRFFTAR
jgi:hypothetical protein